MLGALRIEHLFDAVISIEDMWMFGHLRPKPDARMLRALCARLRVHPSRCVLVEDTLQHQKAARAVGMGTAWMLRYVRGRSVAPRPRGGRPAYVDQRLRSLRALSRRCASAIAQGATACFFSKCLPARWRGSGLCQNAAAASERQPIPHDRCRRTRRHGSLRQRRTGADADRRAHRPPPRPARKRPKPGERRVQILQTLASMLEQPGAERITTAALAAKLDVSEAALYRHFASKAQMFEGLIEFIESSVFTLVNQITERETSGAAQAQRIVALILQFGEKNPGMVRVMVGDALVFENERLTVRMNQFFDRVESQLRQSLRLAAEGAGSMTPTVDAGAHGLGDHRVRRRPAAALCALGLQAQPDRAPRRGTAAADLLNAARPGHA